MLDWVVVLLSFVALSLSAWLTIEKMTGRVDSLVGCGQDGGCGNVLGSRWSVVFGVIPVSALSSLLYAGIIGSVFLRKAWVGWFRIFAAFLILAAAVWFTVLQLIVVKSICPRCMTMHGLGVALAVVILLQQLRKPGSSSGMVSACLAAFVSFLCLAGVQYFSPELNTHRVDTEINLPDSGAAEVNDHHALGEGRLVSFFNGKKSYRVNMLPHLGDAEAPYVVVKYFDYTCSSCKEVHDKLERVQSDYGGKLTVIVLPVPLNRACNPHLPQGVKDHENACDLAKIALRVWLADPEKFAEFHDGLFDFYQQPMEVVEAMAYSLVEASKMDAVRDEDVEKLLSQNVRDYEAFVKKTPVMPKILMGNSILQGMPRDASTLEGLLKQHTGLRR